MEGKGMISKEFCEIQETHRRLGGSYLSGAKWAQSLSIKLMEMTHSQWLVRNFLIHDKISGMLSLRWRERKNYCTIDIIVSHLF